jgi:hypothetical protein
MLAVPDAAAAVHEYAQALRAVELWNPRSVVGMEVDGAPILLAEAERSDWCTPAEAGSTPTRVEWFCDDPDAVVARAVAAGATAT